MEKAQNSICKFLKVLLTASLKTLNRTEEVRFAVTTGENRLRAIIWSRISLNKKK